MIGALRDRLCRFLRVPPEPEPPSGSPGSLRVFRAGRNYLRYKQVGWAIGSLFALVGFLIVEGILFQKLMGRWGDELVSDSTQGWFLLLTALAFLFVVGQIVLSFLVLTIDYEMRWYMVTDRSLRIREGVFSVHEMTMTLANIQNVSLSQGPIQRLLGIADLEVRTAGGGGVTPGEQGAHAAMDMHRGRFRGIEGAEAIRDLMFERVREARSTGLGDHDEEPDTAASGLVEALVEVRDEARRLRAVVTRAGETDES